MQTTKGRADFMVLFFASSLGNSINIPIITMRNLSKEVMDVRIIETNYGSYILLSKHSEFMDQNEHDQWEQYEQELLNFGQQNWNSFCLEIDSDLDYNIRMAEN